MKKINVDKYFYNGVIYTANNNDSVVDAIAVYNEKIVFVGCDKDGKIYRDNAKEVVDLQGKMMMPGMMDSHMHPVFLDSDFNVYGYDEQKTIDTIREFVENNPEKDDYFGTGFVISIFPDDEGIYGPKKERLDEICSDKPIIVFGYDGHSAWLNSKGFEYCNITKDTVAPRGGKIILNEDKELWGVVTDSAIALVKIPENIEKEKAFLQGLTAHFNSLGLTALMGPDGNGFGILPMRSFKKLDEENSLTMRVRHCSIITEWNTTKDYETLKHNLSIYSKGNVKTIGAKFFLDGVADNSSALMLQPYLHQENYYGEPGWDQEDLDKAVAQVGELGVVSHFHSLGDGAVAMALNAIEYSIEKNGQKDYRNALTHLQNVADTDFKRFADTKSVAVPNPVFMYKVPNNYWASKQLVPLGEERANKLYPMKTFFDYGVVVASATDFPVTPNPNPFESIQIGITRNMIHRELEGGEDNTDANNPEYLLWPEERVSLTQMLRTYTINGAYTTYDENTSGSLEVGKFADMIIIDQNLFEIDVMKIKDTQVLQTYFNGKLVYEKNRKFFNS